MQEHVVGWWRESKYGNAANLGGWEKSQSEKIQIQQSNMRKKDSED